MNETTTSPLHRLRVTYRHGPELRYISNLDLIRLFERALRRARLPIAYSGGFNAHPRIHIAAPLPVGFAGENEMADFLLSQPVEPAAFQERLMQQLPQGLALLSVVVVARKEPSLAAQLREARYRAQLPATLELERVREDVRELLAREQIARSRRGKKGRMRKYDLRPLILALVVVPGDAGPQLEMTLAARDAATGRPEEVLAALGYSDIPTDITRVQMMFEESS